PGTRDTFTLVIDWGDGTAIEHHSFAAGTRDFAFDHTFTLPGFYDIVVTLQDDDLGVITGTTEARLSGVVLEGTTLVIAGTHDDENAMVRRPVEPIAYWNFNETGGSTVADSAGTPQNGTLYTDGGVNQTVAGPSASDAPFGAQNAIGFNNDK